MNIGLNINNLFVSPVYDILVPIWVSKLNNICDKYIEEAKKNNQPIVDEGIDPFRFIHFTIQAFKPN